MEKSNKKKSQKREAYTARYLPTTSRVAIFVWEGLGGRAGWQEGKREAEGGCGVGVGYFEGTDGRRFSPLVTTRKGLTSWPPPRHPPHLLPSSSFSFFNQPKKKWEGRGEWGNGRRNKIKKGTQRRGGWKEREAQRMTGEPLIREKRKSTLIWRNKRRQKRGEAKTTCTLSPRLFHIYIYKYIFVYIYIYIYLFIYILVVGFC